MNLRILQFIIFLLVPAVNFGVGFFFESPFNDDSKVLIQPAGYAFAIWGPIFLGMIIYSWFQLQQTRVPSKYLDNATKAGILAGLASIAFVPISYSDIQWLGFINIIWHLCALIWLFLSLRKQIVLEHDTATPWFYIPTHMYLGWICAATAVSSALTLTELGVNLDIQMQEMITVLVIAVLTGLGIYMASIKAYVIPLVFIWALIGIIVENGSFPLIRYGSLVGILLLSAITLPQIIKVKRLVN